MSKPRMVGIDAPKVTADEAVELMTHHLLIAAAYFEAVPEGPEVWGEVHRIMASKGETVERIAVSRVWFIEMTKHYDRLKEEQGP